MRKKVFAVLGALLLCSALLCACGEEAAAPEAEPTETSAGAISGGKLSAEQDTAPEQEAKKELPPPPDVDIESWEFLYAGINNGVGRYAPSIANIENQYMDVRAVEATREFLAATREQGYQVWINAAYRNFEYNMYYYEQAMVEYGSAYEAAKHVYPPGTSEHSTALAFDITDEQFYAANYYNLHDETVADTEVYKWMAENCTQYGFIVRYPEGKEEFYERGCYAGHFRYVGKEAAEYIMENDLCLEEFLALYE